MHPLSGWVGVVEVVDVPEGYEPPDPSLPSGEVNPDA